MTAEQRLEAKLAELAIELPPAPGANGLYTPLLVQGNLAYASGHLPVRPDGELVSGRQRWRSPARPGATWTQTGCAVG